MAEAFLTLSAGDRREALAVAADRSGRPLHLLEKDVWVVWALATLFGSDLGEHLVFKGGTSLVQGLLASSGAFPRTWISPTTSAPSPLTWWARMVRLCRKAGARRSDGRRPFGTACRNGSMERSSLSLPMPIDVQSLPATLRVEGDKLFVDYEATAAGSG